MRGRVLAVNVAGATDRLTLGAYYRVVREWRLKNSAGFVVVIDDKGDSTLFYAGRFEPVEKRQEAILLNTYKG